MLHTHISTICNNLCEELSSITHGSEDWHYLPSTNEVGGFTCDWCTIRCSDMVELCSYIAISNPKVITSTFYKNLDCLKYFVNNFSSDV